MAETNKKKSGFSKLLSFFRACIGELKKISWPTVSTTTKNFGIVVLVILIAGLFIFGLDMGLYELLGLVMNTGSSAVS
ncbi:MAG: preprotein translocase subunit SecE [Ruminococcus sp.]|nr:preprotein translocase subunit SecE [Ruminococcus sp.]